MKIQLLYFAQAARLVGRGDESLTMSAGQRLSELQQLILQRHQALAPIASSLSWAVDQRVEVGDLELEDGQVIAVMPPFSGG